MGIASEMKELTRDITSSHKDRVKRIGEIREEVKGARVEAQDMIHSFKDSRKETSRQLRRDLARDKTSRTSKVKGILRESQNILKGFENSRKEAGAQLRKDLSRSTAARQSDVKKILDGSRKLLKGFHTSRQNVSYELRKDLGRSRAKSKSEVGELLGSAQSLVKDFQTSRREAGGQLRRDLAQSKASIESDVRQMQSAFRKARGNVSADLKGARAAWQGLAGTIQVSKGRTEKPLEAEVSAPEEGNPDLEIKMLTAVREHPEGTTLAGIADSLDVASVVLGRVSKSLMKKGVIRKEEKLYFPADGESDSKQGLHFRPPLR
ncbi:MAG: hypothetical protein ABSF21_05040 [Dehalococcoidia bacterium]